jgi:hypothetical protein
MSPRLVTEERGAREDEGGEVLCHALCMQALRAVIGTRHMTEAWESASQWGRLEAVAVLRGFAGFPRPNALARPRTGGDTAADRREQTPPNPQTHTRGTEVAPVLATVMVSMPPSLGPPERCGVLGLIAILPYHTSKAKAYDIAP